LLNKNTFNNKEETAPQVASSLLVYKFKYVIGFCAFWFNVKRAIDLYGKNFSTSSIGSLFSNPSSTKK